jgi:16S rRNA G527 N7-methylase RsmG
MAALGLENVELVAGDIHELDAATLGGPFDLAFTRAFLMWVTSPFLLDLVLRKPQAM